MPIYKIEGKKDGKQKYRVRINFKDIQGKDKQIDRVVYGNTEAKELEASLTAEVKEQPPETRITLQFLYDKYIAAKKYELRETSIYKMEHILKRHVLPFFEPENLPKLTVSRLQE